MVDIQTHTNHQPPHAEIKKIKTDRAAAPYILRPAIHTANKSMHRVYLAKRKLMGY